MKRSIALPDVHSGYGFAIGNVAAFDMNNSESVVSPGGVGFDINCGVRLIRTNLVEVRSLLSPWALASHALTIRSSCRVVPCHAALCRVVSCCVVPCRAVPCCAVPWTSRSRTCYP